MGLISRVSSRTYRFVQIKFSLKTSANSKKMAVALEEIEAQSFVKSAQSDAFSRGEEHDVQFTYSGGAQKGNYVSSAHVTRTGRMKDGKFTKTAIITLHDMG